MARLTALPSIDIIRGYKGILDFYVRRGQPCVRKWPHTPRSRRTAGSNEAAALFGQILKSYRLVAEQVLEAYRENAKGIPRTPRDVYVSGVLGHLHERTIPPPPPPPEEEMYDAYVCLRDKKPSLTQGGTFTSGAWQTRDLNDEQADAADICALAANQFILAPGTYRCLISCPAYRVNQNKARLYNVTGAAVLLVGSTDYANSTYRGSIRSFIAGRFTVVAAQTLEIQHRCFTTHATYGFGYAAGWQDEIYTLAEFWRERETE